LPWFEDSDDLRALCAGFRLKKSLRRIDRKRMIKRLGHLLTTTIAEIGGPGPADIQYRGTRDISKSHF
jgi:hypothetical protein